MVLDDHFIKNLENGIPLKVKIEENKLSALNDVYINGFNFNEIKMHSQVYRDILVFNQNDSIVSF
ncbi:MAG: hypothetical protein IPN09_13475 [Bacteroidetes bacterium]|nr:hypothetical protein [Bacteroidota bacterium]